jgi:hypothetical protein
MLKLYSTALCEPERAGLEVGSSMYHLALHHTAMALLGATSDDGLEAAGTKVPSPEIKKFRSSCFGRVVRGL